MSTMSPEQLYESDFYAWTQQQAKELRRLARARPNAALDLAHIAEEIRDLGKSEGDAVFSLAQKVMEHFLLVEHSPAVENRRRWLDEIEEFRDQIERKISPTIRRRLERDLDGVFARAPARPAQNAALRRGAGRWRAARDASLHPRADPRRLGAGQAGAKSAMSEPARQADWPRRERFVSEGGVEFDEPPVRLEVDVLYSATDIAA